LKYAVKREIKYKFTHPKTESSCQKLSINKEFSEKNPD